MVNKLRVCSVCDSNEPVYYDDFSGLSYCGSCFTSYVYRKVVRTVKRYGMFVRGDRVVLAVSGGRIALCWLTFWVGLAGSFAGLSLWVSPSMRVSAPSREIIELKL